MNIDRRILNWSAASADLDQLKAEAGPDQLRTVQEAVNIIERCFIGPPVEIGEAEERSSQNTRDLDVRMDEDEMGLVLIDRETGREVSGQVIIKASSDWVGERGILRVWAHLIMRRKR